jgi:t-SNARE complex subunit (syntaxin)
MAAWLPVLKAFLPYLDPIVQAAVPAFTRKKSEKTDPLVTQQIAELQEAVKANAEAVKVMAEQVQGAVRAMEQGAIANEKAIRNARVLALVAVVIALASLCLVLAVWVR